MLLAQWSPRRLAAVWGIGIVLQVAIVAVPMAIAIHLVRRDGPRIRQQGIVREAQLKGSERADSVSRAEQIAAARAAGTFYFRADGQTVFAVVGMPSGRPDAQRVAALRRSMRQRVNVLLGVQFGAIPLALAALTIAWFAARRQNDSPALGGGGES
jgi:hypothetical protein